MPVLMIMEARGATTDQYEKVNELMGIRSDDDAPDGLVQHIAASDGDSLVVIDVWESPEQLQRFFEGRLAAALAGAGIDPESTPPKILPVHNAFQGAGTEPNVVLVMEMDDLSPDVYDQMTNRMPAHYELGKSHPAVSHTAARSESGGMVVVDVWDSPESFGKFAEEAIGPLADEVGMSPPQPRVLKLHNRLRGRAAQRA
jgi:hypothetical protein